MTASANDNPSAANKPSGDNDSYQSERPLSVAVLSLDIIPGDKERNLSNAGEMLNMLPAGTDVAVLPELFTTSFMKDTDRMLSLAESRDGLTIRKIRQWADSHGILIAGSYLFKESAGNGTHRYYNRGFMVMPDGQEVFYDKHHLFCLSKEAELFTHGHRRPPVVNFKGWNISIRICYELRFPVWNRNVGMQADLVLVPANWPAARGYAWRHLLIARAIENQVVMAGADCSGTDDYGNYDGMALIVDELGRQISPPLSQAPQGCPPPPPGTGKVVPTRYGDILSAFFKLEDVKKLRGWLPTERDADRFTVETSSAPNQ